MFTSCRRVYFDHDDDPAARNTRKGQCERAPFSFSSSAFCTRYRNVVRILIRNDCNDFVFFFFLLQTCNGQVNQFLRAPPKVEGPPKLLDSFLPAGMQIMAHLTELMKYEVRPSQTPSNPWTTTQRPTSSHKPAIYAPEVPLGPEAYFSRGEYLEL